MQHTSSDAPNRRLGILARQCCVSGQDQLERCNAAASSGFTSNFPQCENATVFPPAAHDALELAELLPGKALAIRDRVRSFMEREVAPVIAQYWEKAEFPHSLVPKFASLGLGGGVLHGNGCAGLTMTEAAVGMIEIARVDASMSTFYLVHNFLAALTIGLLGSEEQKQELLPKIASYEYVACWALTEPSNGSDAAALSTTATKVPGGWLINGQKRWIGNGTFAEVTVVWARSSETGQVNAFVVRKGTQGFRTAKIENKIALRCVQNADMVFERCFVPDSARLPGVESFKDTNKVLAVSRVMVAWQPVGIAMGVYDMCHRYLQQRQQFGAPLASFQLVQEKLQRLQANIQDMWLMCWRVTQLYEQGKLSHEQASLVKAHTSLRGRECVALGREMLGGNGILSDFHVAKAFCDLEAIYTYEGTYEVNALVAGRGATGVAAFRAPRGSGKDASKGSH